MIPQITEVNFPSYATLHQATVSFTEMGDRTISTQVRIDGDVVPNFHGWELEFKGERFVLPINDPQAQKDNTTRNSLVDLVFQSWPIQQLKQYFFMSMSEVETGVAIPNQYNASVVLPVESFVNLFNSVLKYYFGNQISMSLYGMGTGIYSTEPVSVEINYTHIWEVLTKFYELFGLLWRIERDSSTGNYIIKVGYSQPEIDDHDFEYGYNGGLLKFERQVQDENISNILLGRGGEKNLPYRYFKKADPQNPNWAEDPDAIPELANIYFDRLRDATFRWYVRGWMQNPNCDQAYAPYPSYSESDIPEYSADDPLKQQLLYAFRRGKTDARFNPVEFVRDEPSIESYGERWGALENNDEIYPTIQNMPPWARVDNVIAVSEITTDDIQAASKAAVTENVIDGSIHEVHSFYNEEVFEDTLFSHEFSVPENKIGRLSWDWLLAQNGVTLADWSAYITLDVDPENIRVVDIRSEEEVPTGAIPAGHYRVEIDIKATNLTEQVWNNVRFGLSSLSVIISDIDSDSWKPTFDIWVKNIWGTTKQAGETDEEYSMRVWGPILGDRVGKEARVVFSDGFMAVSEDYEFPIASYPVPDNTKSFQGEQSAWRITLRKSDAEFNTTGLYIPNATTGGKPVAGNHFFFTGIDMPSQYVLWAEEAVCNSKIVKLSETSVINPTWVITLDKVRVHTVEDEDYGTKLADRLSAGCIVHTKDKRFTNNNVLSLRVQSITYTWNEGDMVPNIDVILADKVLAVTNPIETLTSDMTVVKSTYAKTSEIEAVVRRVASPMFLKKTGEQDRSESPTMFASKVSSDNFRQGDVGGTGWGHYDDGAGDSVLELDKLVVRKELRVNSLVANQVTYVGGKQINSAANIECTQVIETEDGYNCYFDQKGGTVKNLFVVGDFAMGQVFNPSNAEVRYYRCQVVEVGDNYIKLSKSIKDGSGYPLEGDIIVQYGNASDASRQFVIVRDVIGGGYERMISNLSTVSSNGNEYYFAGRQSGSSPRWFVGDANNEYAEWVAGRLNIKGTLIVRNSDGTYQAMTDYMSGVANQMSSLQSQIDGQIQSWASGEAPTAQTEPLPKIVEGQVDPSTANFPASGWSTASDREKHIGDIYVDDSTGQGYRYTKRSNNGVTEYYWTRITDEELASALQAIQALQTAVGGLEYLKAALPGSTLVQGGLVLSSLIQLGQVENGAFRVYSGINGILDQTLADPSRSIASWYGGPMVDHELSPSAASYAKSLFRHDGSGYLASGKINWDALGNGGIPGVSWSGNTITIAGDVRLGSVSGDTVTRMLNLLRQISDWFGEDEDHNIYVKRYNGSTRVFYNDGPVSSGGISTTGGGGGGSVNALRDWANYRPDDTTQVLGSNLGKGLKDSIETLEGYFTNGVAKSAADSDTLAGHASTYYAHQVNLGSAVYAASNGIISLPAFPTTARELTDADDLCYVDPDEGVSVTIDDPGVTGTVLWGAENANQVALSVNGVSKLLLKAAAIAGIESSISTLSGYFINGSARNALSLGGYNASYFAPASGLTALQEVVAGKQDTINDLATIRTNAGHGETAYGWGNHASAGYATKNYVNTALANYYTKTEVDARVFFEEYTLPNNGGTAIKLKDAYVGMFASGFVSSGGISTTGGGGGTAVNALRDWANYRQEDTTQVLGSNLGKGLKDDITTLQGYFTNGVADYADDANTLGGHASTYFAHTVRLGSTDYPASNGLINIPSITTGVISDLETWISNKGFVTRAVNDLTNYYLKSQTYTQAEVNALIGAINQFHYEIYPNLGGITSPASNVLYLIGPTGEGDDRYEEYVYASNDFVKIGETSIDLSDYINSVVASGSGNYITGFSKSGNTLTLSFGTLASWVLSANKPSYTFSEIGSKPTTLAGYGITDALFGAHAAGSDNIPITLGSTTQNVLIAHQSLSGYVNSINTASEAVVGKQFLSGVSKVAESSVIDFQFSRILLDDVDGTDDLKAIEALTGTSGLLRKTGSNTWSLDTTQYITKDVNNLANYYTKTEVDARVFFEEYTLPNNGGTAIKLKDAYVGMFASGFVSSGGISTSGGGGGTAVNALRDWANYRADDTTQVLGSNLGKGLKDSIEVLQGYFTNGVANNAADSDTLAGHASTYYAHQVNIGSTVYTASNGIVSLPAFPTTVRELADADDLCYVDPDEGVSVTIDDPGVTGTVLWGAESANQVALSVNGVSKLLLKAAAISGLESSISTLSGYFINGSARNALSLGGYNASYFATASGLTALQEAVAGKQDTINDLATIRSGAGHGETAYGWGNHASVGYATQNYVNTALANYYVKSQTYTQAEVNALIAAINQFHYEIAASTSAVANPQPNVLYLIGPIGSGSDKYEEYVYPNATTGWTKIGETSIDLTGYVNAISPSAETDVYLCPDCDYFYDPAVGDPIGGIAAGTAFAELPSEWVCPICGASKADFVEGGRQFVSGVSKSSSSSTIAFTLNRLALRDLSGANNLKAIEYASGSGLLKKNADGTWGFDTTQYITKDVNNLTNYYTKTEVDARVFFEEYTLPNNGGTAIKLKDAYVGMFASGFVSSGGISTAGGGGGTAVNALRDWANYRADDTTQVLGSNLGKGLKDSIETLQGYFTNGVANNAAEAASLALSHTIWGQSFNGTQNVSGAMSGVSAIDSLMYFDATNGRVGIGISSPAYSLDVSGTSRISGNSVIGGDLTLTNGHLTLSGTNVYVATPAVWGTLTYNWYDHEDIDRWNIFASGYAEFHEVEVRAGLRFLDPRLDEQYQDVYHSISIDNGSFAFSSPISIPGLAISSNNLVSNLNADLLDGHHAADFALVTDINSLIDFDWVFVANAGTYDTEDYIHVN